MLRGTAAAARTVRCASGLVRLRRMGRSGGGLCVLRRPGVMYGDHVEPWFTRSCVRVRRG